MKIAICYASVHHGNTEKLVKAIAEKYEVKLIDATSTQNAYLADYDLIGFASGIYYSKYHASVIQFAKDNLPNNKPVFLISTYGADNSKYDKNFLKEIDDKHPIFAGSYGSLGLDTYGPFKLMGGIAKGHPTEREIADAVVFMGRVIEYVDSLKTDK